MKTTLLMLMAVVMVGCGKKENPPKPEDLSHSTQSFLEALHSGLPNDWEGPWWRDEPQLPFANNASEDNSDGYWTPERKAKAMQRYKSELAEWKRELAEWKRKQAEQERKADVANRKLHDYELAMEKWYNSLVVCLHCGSDLAAKGAKVCPECLREQRD